MSLKELKRIITTSLELEDMDVINGLRDKLKSRLDITPSPWAASECERRTGQRYIYE